MGKSAKQRKKDYFDKQSRREEALDLINKISQLETKFVPVETKVDKKQEEKSKKKKKRKNKKKSAVPSEEQDSATEDSVPVVNGESNAKKQEEKPVVAKQEVKLNGGFIDHRGSIKAFENIQKVSKKRKSYTWKEKLAEQERKRQKTEDEELFESSEEEEQEESDGDDEHDNASDESENEEEEFNGFSASEESEAEENLDDGSEDESADDSDNDSEDDKKAISIHKTSKALNAKASEFMNWIEQRTEKSAPTPVLNVDYKALERAEDRANLSDEEEIKLYKKENNEKAFLVEVIRDSSVQQQRMELPVFKEEHKIMEEIKYNDTVIICGETGSGKTTQVPQFLFEAGYGDSRSGRGGIIGVTQPRRVAAMSMAERLKKELGNHGDKVGYQIRFDSNVSKKTKIKLMTDGVLLREMMSDFLLTKYSVIIIDEAHERNINTDILIGMLSRIVQLRAKKNNRLKLVIMSATLRVSDFAENKNLFKTPPPIIKVDARMYPVSVHFNKKTPFDYVDEAYNKVCKIHQKLPRGGILVFLTSQQEIIQLVKKLRARFPIKQKKLYEETVELKVNSKNVGIEDEEVEFDVLEDLVEQDGNTDDESSESEEEGFEEALEEGQTSEDPLYVLPLYSLLPTAEQMKVFQDPPANSRVCIISTNVAETSITIPNIRYVVDSGRSKQKLLKNSVQSYAVSWVLQASAEQRSGRAGRTGPGHTYRLYSSAVFSEFDQFSVPEILRMPIESVILQMKSIGIDNIVNFPFPTPISSAALYKAESLLENLKALDANKVVTELGKSMSLFPVSPRFAKILLSGNQFNCLPYVIAIVCILSVGDPFLTEVDLGIDYNFLNNEDHEEDDVVYNQKLDKKDKMRDLLSKYREAQAKFSSLDKNSDALKLLSAISAVGFYLDKYKRDQFIKDNFMRHKLIEEVNKLRKQLIYIVKVNTTQENIGVQINYEKEMKLKPPTKAQVFALKQIITTGFIDQVAIRSDLLDSDIRINKKMTINSVPYTPIYLVRDSYESFELDSHIYIHPGSILNGETPPNYMVYLTLDLNASGKKIRMRPLTDIGAKALGNLAKGTNLLSYSKPLGPPYGPELLNPNKQKCYVVPRFGATIQWDLPPIRVVQNKINGQWVTE